MTTILRQLLDQSSSQLAKEKEVSRMKFLQLATSVPQTNLLQAISTVGFPIVMCIVMFIYIQKIEERHRQEMESLRKAIDETKSAVNNNTVVMNRVLDKMEGWHGTE